MSQFIKPTLLLQRIKCELVENQPWENPDSTAGPLATLEQCLLQIL